MNEKTPFDRPDISPPEAKPGDSGADSKFESLEDNEFDRQLRAWSTRPPATSAKTAAERLVSRLPARRRNLPWRWAAAAALILGIAAWQFGSGRSVTDGSLDRAANRRIDQPTTERAQIETARSATEADLLIIPLDGKTTLYMTMTAPAAKKGSSI